MPHKLTERNKIERISICNSLLKRPHLNEFLKRLVTGDEKWILYDNVVKKKSWCGPGETPETVAKAGLYPKKVMLSIWWDWQGVLYYELLPQNQTIDSTKYFSLLNKLKQAIKDNRRKFTKRNCVVFLHDNARPYASLKTYTHLLRFGWDILPHPPYSPDIAPSDYHLFRALQNNLNEKTFKTLDDVKKHLDQFFASKSQSFYERGIMDLPNRWRDIIEQNGKYIID